MSSELPPPPPPRLPDHNLAPAHDRQPSPSRLKKYGKKVLAVALAGGVAFGIAKGLEGSSDQQNAHETIAESSQSLQPAESIRNLTDFTSQPSSELIATFTDSIADSECDSPAVAERAAQIYHDAFEAIDYQDASLPELELAADTIVGDLREARSQLEFGNLPSDYQELVHDVDSGQAHLPLERYQAALDELGIDAAYEWQAQPSSQGNIPRDLEAVPIAPDSLADSVAARRAMLALIDSYAMTPTKVIDMAGGLKFYFGDITYGASDSEGDGAIGLTVSDFNGDRILIDISSDFHKAKQDQYVKTISHEMGHVIDYRASTQRYEVCNEILDTAFKKQYPAGFEFGKDTAVALQQEGVTPDGFTTLQSIDQFGDKLPNDATAVSTNPYGTYSLQEAKATITENLFNPSHADTLFDAPASSETIFKQLALQISRFAEVDPAITDFYTEVLQAAHLENAARDQLLVATDNPSEVRLAEIVATLNDAQIG